MLHPRPLRPRPARDEQGSLVLDVLISMAVFGLLAIIAVSALGQWRERAYQQAVLADTKRLAEMLSGRISESPSSAAAAAQAFQEDAAGDGEGALVQAVSMSRTTASATPVAGSVSSADYEIDQITDPVRATGIRLYSGNRVPASSWTTDGVHFGFCVEHVTEGRADAWASYRTDKGGIYEHGRKGGCPALPSAPAEQPVSPPPVVPTVPAPFPEPPAPEPETEPTPEPVEAAVPVNDTCDGAFEIPQSSSNDGATSSGPATNLGATDRSSVWFRTWAPISMYSTYALESTSGGALPGSRTMTLYRGPDTNTNTGVCPPEGQMTSMGAVTGANPGITVRTGTGNQNYYLKVTSDASDETDFQVGLRVHRSTIVRDQYGSAEPISVNQNQSQIVATGLSTSLWGTVEPGELAVGYSTIWYRLHNYWSPATPRYTLTTSGTGAKPLGQHKIEVFSGGSSAANPGTPVASVSGNGAASRSFDGPPSGGTMMVRVTSRSGLDSGAYTLRLSRGAN